MKRRRGLPFNATQLRKKALQKVPRQCTQCSVYLGGRRTSRIEPSHAMMMRPRATRSLPAELRPCSKVPRLSPSSRKRTPRYPTTPRANKIIKKKQRREVSYRRNGAGDMVNQAVPCIRWETWAPNAYTQMAMSNEFAARPRERQRTISRDATSTPCSGLVTTN